MPGAIVVVKRKASGADKKTGSRAGYHATVLDRLNKHWIVGVGGNQENQVKRGYYPRSKYDIIALRKPAEL